MWLCGRVAMFDRFIFFVSRSASPLFFQMVTKKKTNKRKEAGREMLATTFFLHSSPCLTQPKNKRRRLERERNLIKACSCSLATWFDRYTKGRPTSFFLSLSRYLNFVTIVVTLPPSNPPCITIEPSVWIVNIGTTLCFTSPHLTSPHPSNRQLLLMLSVGIE